MANPCVTIISTGSQGNVAQINNDIIVDLGLAKSKYLAEPKTDGLFQKISAVFITHEHKDHADPGLIKLLHDQRPDVFKRQLFMPDATFRMLAASNSGLHNIMMNEFDKSHIIKAGDTLTVKTRSGKYEVQVFCSPHGQAECVAFTFTTPANQTIVWATDTEHLDNLPDKKFDVLCIEGNWDTQLLLDALQDENTAGHANSSMRHLSVQDFEKFVKTHKLPHSAIIQLHMSNIFGVRSALNNTEEV